MIARAGLDIRMLRHSGIGTYLRGLLEGFHQAGISPEERPVLFGDPDSASAFSEKKIRAFAAPIYSLREQARYPSRLRQCELWHAPHYNVPLFKGKTKLVVTLHDIIHWIFRKQFLGPVQTAYAGFMLNRAVRTSDHIIAVSEHTKKDLMETFGAPAEKITVIYEGVGRAYRPMEAEELSTRFRTVSEKYRIPEDFFLYVGLMKPHKNVLWLVEIFKKLKAAKRLRSALVLVGRKDRRYPKGYEALRDLETGPGLIYIPEIEFPELLTLYNRATALVHPSLYEGFGLTLLEAMKCGTPVISSRAASLGEVAGDAAVLVDPRSADEMAEALIKVETNAGLRADLTARGFERVKIFDWAETARQTVAVYRKTLGGQ